MILLKEEETDFLDKDDIFEVTCDNNHDFYVTYDEEDFVYCPVCGIGVGIR